MAKIVVLDSHTLNPGDLSWDRLRALGPCIIHERTPPDEIIRRADGADVLLTNKCVLDKNILSALPSLRYIGLMGTGTNAVDLEAATERRIVVTNVPAYSTASTAQATLALLLELTNHVGDLNRSVHEGRWAACKDFSYWDSPAIELAGMTMGIVGFGSIGQAVARLALTLGMTILIHTRTQYPVPEGLAIKYCSLDNLFSRSDVVSLHCPLTPATRNLVDARRLALMKPTAFLLNAARGPLIDEPSLAAALNEGRLAGAGLDVLAVEPPQESNLLTKARNCIITPHVGWCALASRKRLLEAIIANLRAYFEGKPINAVVST